MTHLEILLSAAVAALLVLGIRNRIDIWQLKRACSLVEPAPDIAPVTVQFPPEATPISRQG
jgi:hypothetical protein